MIKTSASQFKAKLGRYMQAVRDGKEVMVTDRKQPIARLVPFQSPSREQRLVQVSQARDPSAPALGDLRIRSISYKGQPTTDILVEERSRR